MSENHHDTVLFTPHPFTFNPPRYSIPPEIMFSAVVEPTDWILEIAPDSHSERPRQRQDAIWQQSRSYPNAWGRWNAYLNQLCLETILPWLKTEYLPTATTWVGASSMPMFWDVVNGAVITVGTTRIALIPTEAIDRSELEVPQEWIDIPSWAADYYLGVQVASEEGKIYIYGYATHQQLKTQGRYDRQDRTYCLATEDLNPDLNMLWLTYDRYPVTATRAVLPPISPLAIDRIVPLIDRLGDPAEVLPRLAVPFELWAAIIENPELHQRLYQQRQTGQFATVVTRLSDWLQGQIDVVWQTLDLVLSPAQIAIAVRSDVRSVTTSSDLYRAKVYSLATGQIALAIGIAPISDTESRINLQIHPVGGAKQLPGSTQLKLLIPEGGEIGRASATETETIEFQFRANVGETFQVEIVCGGEAQTERFEL